MDWTAIVQALAPAIGAAVTAVVRQIVPAIPRWILPILATVVGSASAALADAGTSQAVTLGLASVGLREILDQARKAVR